LLGVGEGVDERDGEFRAEAADAGGECFCYWDTRGDDSNGGGLADGFLGEGIEKGSGEGRRVGGLGEESTVAAEGCGESGIGGQQEVNGWLG
jgi:hypothetical protein